MSDTRDMLLDQWESEREERRAVGTERRAAAPDELRKHGLTFTSHNNGAHLVIIHEGIVVDYWPGTTLWMPRHNPKRRHGFEKLVQYLQSTSRFHNEHPNHPTINQ